MAKLSVLNHARKAAMSLAIIGSALSITAAAQSDPDRGEDRAVNLKQLRLSYEEALATEFAAETQKIRSCDDADELALAVGAEVVDRTDVPLSALPDGLAEMLRNTATGHATRPFGSAEAGVRVLVVCGEGTLAGQVTELGPVERAANLNRQAVRLQQNGLLAEALPFLAEALSLRREALGNNHQDTIISINNYAGVLAGLGRSAEAEPLMAEALRLRREVLGERHPDTLILLNNHAGILDNLGRKAEALSLYSETLRLRREILGVRHPDTLTSLHDYAIVLDDIGRFEEALPLYFEALQLRREVLGERHIDTLDNLSNYASALQEVGRSDEAIALLVELAALSTEELGELHPFRLDYLSSYARALRDYGDLSQAERLFSDVLRLRREVFSDRDPSFVSSMIDYSAILVRLGRFEEAEPLAAQALRLSREIYGQEEPKTLDALEHYAGILDDLGRSSEAEPLYADVLRLRREVLGERHPATLTSLGNYAFILQSLGRDNEADPILAEVLRLKKEVLGERHIDTLRSLSNYASNLARLGRPDEALPLFAEALRISRETLPENHQFTLGRLNSYGAVLADLNMHQEAEPLIAEALRASRETLGDRHPDTLESLSSYAGVLFRLGRFTEAEPLAAEVVRLRRDVFGGSHPLTLSSLETHAVLLSALGRVDDALPLLREAVLTSRQRITTLSSSGLQAQAQAQRENAQLRSNERFLADLIYATASGGQLFGEPEIQEGLEALQYASRSSTSKAITEAAAARYASDQGLDSLVQERQSLTSEWARADASLVEQLSEGSRSNADRGILQNRISAIETRLVEIDDRLRSEAPQYSAILNQPALDARAVTETLQPGEAFLLIVPTQIGTHVMVLTRESVQWVQSDLTENEINGAVRNLREGLEVSDEYLPYFDLEGASELYQALIAPVEETLEGIERLYVVADGELSRLPFGVLVASAPPVGADADDQDVLRSTDWLADRFALVQLPSLQSLSFIRKYGAERNDQPTTSFMGFGNPVLDGVALLRGARSGAISPVDAAELIGPAFGGDAQPLMDPTSLKRMARLPGTERELLDVRAALDTAQTSLFMGEEMTETAIRSVDLSNVDILHLATHGLTSEQSGARAEPGLVFTPPENATAANDGYLSASEVVGLDLTAADWVIMSACNTASPSGQAGETGLSGLSRAFFYAGARSLLVSHWPVFDEVAAKLTVGVLTRAENGQPRAEALQAAMIEIRNDETLNASHPAVWAPFTLVGEGL